MNQFVKAAIQESISMAKQVHDHAQQSRARAVLGSVSAHTNHIVHQSIDETNVSVLLAKKIKECRTPSELQQLRGLHESILHAANTWKEIDAPQSMHRDTLAKVLDTAKEFGLDQATFLLMQFAHRYRNDEYVDDGLSDLAALTPLFVQQEEIIANEVASVEQAKEPLAPVAPPTTEVHAQSSNEQMMLLQTEVESLLGELMQLLLEERRSAWKKATPRWKFWARFPEKQERATVEGVLKNWPADHRKGKDVTIALLTEEVRELTAQKNAILGMSPPMKNDDAFAHVDTAQEPNTLAALDTGIEEVAEQAPQESAATFGGTVTMGHATQGAYVLETAAPVPEATPVFSVSTADIQSTPEVTKDEPRTFPQETTELPVTANAQVLALPYSEELFQTDTLHALLQEGRPIEINMCVEEGQPPVTIHIQEMRTQNNFVIWSTPGQDGLRSASLMTLRRLNEPKVEKHYPIAVHEAKAPRSIDEHILHVSNTIASAVRTPVQLPRKQAQPLLLTHEPVAQEAAPTPVLETVEKKAVPAKPTIDLTTQKLPSDAGVLTRSNIFTASDALLTFEQLHLLAKRQGQYIDGSIFGKKARMMVQGIDPAGNVDIWCTFEDLSTPGKRTVHINNLRQSNDLLPIQMCSGSPEVTHNTERRTHLPFRGSIFVQTLMDELGRGYGPEAENSFAGAQAGELSQLVRDAMRTSSSLEALEPVLLEIIEKYDEEVGEGFARAWRAATSLANNHKTKPVITPVQGTPARQTTSWAKRLTAGIKSLFVG